MKTAVIVNDDGGHCRAEAMNDFVFYRDIVSIDYVL